MTITAEAVKGRCPLNDANCKVTCLCGDIECHRYCTENRRER